MLVTKVIAVAAAFVAVGITGTGAGLLVTRTVPTSAQEATSQTPRVNARASAVKVPAQREGVLVLVGSEIKPGENVPADQVITTKVGDTTTRYRRLKEGDVVEEGQLLARVDDRLARDEWNIAQRKVAAAEADLGAAEKINQEARRRREARVKLSKEGKKQQPYMRTQGLRGSCTRLRHMR